MYRFHKTPCRRSIFSGHDSDMLHGSLFFKILLFALPLIATNFLRNLPSTLFALVLSPLELSRLPKKADAQKEVSSACPCP